MFKFICVFLFLVLAGVVEGGYIATNITDTGDAITATLHSDSPPDITPLLLTIVRETNTRLRIRVTDPRNRRYEVPFPDPVSYRNYRHPTEEPAYQVEVKARPVSVVVTRRVDGHVVFRSSDLVFQDQFLSLTTVLPSPLLYGLGEDAAPLLRQLTDRTHTLWTAGMNYQKGQGVNLYGVHPFHVSVEGASGAATGILLMNSNAMDIHLTRYPSTLTWQPIGGILDLSIFLGSSPVEVVQGYTARIGRPALPPAWALGFHLCRWGYNTTGAMAAVADAMVDQGVPFDTQWNDIDYMHEHEDFTVGDSFAGLREHVDRLHGLGKRYVMMVDPGIHANFSEHYSPLQSGIAQDVFVRNETGGLLVGNVWPGDTVFPDFLYPNTTTWWASWLANFHETQLPFDGVWIDMNEPQSFYDGSNVGCRWGEPLESPPYYPGVRGKLQYQTLCMEARHHSHLHYNVHSLYGWSEAQATDAALRSLRPKNRTFILSRSTFVGSGRWAAHWTGDVYSSWEDLAASIPAIINMNMFGVPMVGADICGFNGYSNPELCVRWSQLGAFYPFSRNHNTLEAIPQEPTAWDTQITEIIRSALLQRYRLFYYLYSLFREASTLGTPVVQGLFMQWPTDPVTWDKDRQFLWGSHLMICPVVEGGVDTVWIYFPPSLWYDLWGMELVSEGGEVIPNYPAPLHTINVFARGGSIVPVVWEQRGSTPTMEGLLAQEEITLRAYLCKMGHANGHLYTDDGVTERGETHEAVFKVRNATLWVSPVAGGGLPGRRVVEVRVAGIQGRVTGVSQDGVEIGFTVEAGVLVVVPDNGQTDRAWAIKWSTE